MIERVLGHLASHGIDEAVLSLGYLPDAFMEAYPDGRVAGMGLTYAVESEPLDTAGAVRFAATVRRHRRDVRRRQRRRAHRSRPELPRGVPPRPWGGGDDRPPPGGRPVRLRRGADRRRGSGHGLRREAAPGRGADQRDQCRHLRARAVGARPDPRGRAGLHRARDLPCHGARPGSVRPLRRSLLARHRDAGRLPRGQLRLSQQQTWADRRPARGRPGRRRPPGRRERHRGRGGRTVRPLFRLRRSSQAHGSSAASSGPARWSRPEPS